MTSQSPHSPIDPMDSPHRPPPLAPSSPSHRRLAIAVDLSDESAHAVHWAVHNYLRPGDAVVLLHVRPTSVLYGADWGSVDLPPQSPADEDLSAADLAAHHLKREEDFDAFTVAKAQDLARPLADAHIPYKIHIVKDHDMKERLCLEVERLGISAVIMGSRGFGAARRSGKSRLGSVSDYCVHHCVCPVVVVRYPDEGGFAAAFDNGAGGAVGEREELRAVPEEEPEYQDAADEHKGQGLKFFFSRVLLLMNEMMIRGK